MRFPQVFRDFRRLIEAIQGLVTILEVIEERQQVLGDSIARLDELELSRARFEAEISGMVLKAEGKLKAANNSEARERQLKKSYESRIDPLYAEGEESEGEGDPVLVDDVARGEDERLHAMRLDVAPNHKANALRAKWGGTRSG